MICSARTSRSWIKYDPAKKIALVVDEWGAWLAPTPGSPEGFLEQQNSQRDAIIAALNINIFARHAERVRGANIAQMVNVLQAMIFTDKEKMLLTPTYHVFRMYLPFQDATSAAGDGVGRGIPARRHQSCRASMPSRRATRKARSGWPFTNLDPNRSATDRRSMSPDESQARAWRNADGAAG